MSMLFSVINVSLYCYCITFAFVICFLTKKAILLRSSVLFFFVFLDVLCMLVCSILVWCAILLL